MKITIKDAVLNDLDKINELLRLSKSYWEYDEKFIEIFMEKFGITSLYLEKHIIKLCHVDDRLAGFYSFGINSENLFELENFFIHPNFIGKGLGKSLWDSCCKTAKDKKIDKFIIWSDPNAENFYLKMGCEKIGVRPSPMLPGRYPPILKYSVRD